MRKLIVSILLCGLATPALGAAPISGRWLTAEKDSIIEIEACGPAHCGKILRILKGPPGGKPAIDSNNPNPALRRRPIEGLTLMSGFVDAGGEWKGTIYDPRAGKTYTSYLQRLANGNLKVKGCVGPFCKSFIYTPAK
jgi:uncharacterized protein (DUF2147 family)